MEDNKKVKGIVWNVASALVGAAISFATTFGIVNTEKTTEIKNKLSGINAKASSVVMKIKEGDMKQALVVAEEIVFDTRDVVKESKELVEKVKENVSGHKDKK